MSSHPKRILAVLVLAVASAHAQTDRSFSLTLSPFHLAAPIVEITGEYALSPKLGVAAIGGLGSLEVEYSNGEKEDIGALELGGQAVYYALGSFRHGLQLGGELLWIKVDPPKEGGVEVDANGVAVGPMVGYKFIAGFGLTSIVQVGYQWLFAKAKAENDAGEQAESSGEDAIMLLNVNLGWSF